MDSLVLHMFAAAGRPEMLWEFDTLVTGTSQKSAVLPFFSTTETHDIQVDWGDGTEATYNGTYSTAPVTHSYASDGVYRIRVIGVAPKLGGSPSFSDGLKLPNLTKCLSFGDLNTTSMSFLFGQEFEYLSQVPISLPPTVTDCRSMFDAAGANTVGGFNPKGVQYWGTGNVTDMSFMFRNLPDFNQDLSAWDTSSVTTMQSMFFNNSSFNGDVTTWNVSNVTTMEDMFNGCVVFDQNIGSWDVSSVTTFREMFFLCAAFDQDISGWDVSSAVNFRSMFAGATTFTSDLSGWNVTSAVTDISSMFSAAAAFNSNLSLWDVSGCEFFDGVFQNASSFDGDISTWNTSSALFFSSMFRNATAFNQDISGWDTSSVTQMGSMFENATSFNQDLSGWCVTLIPSAPSNFDTGATAWTLANSRPVWGTCPP